jgi:hypothetical protein
MLEYATAIHRQEGCCGMCQPNTQILNMSYTYMEGLTNHLHFLFSDLAGVWEIIVYLCLVSDRLPSLKFKEVSLTGWKHHVKIIGTENFCT